jgi:FKBP-type peptidyl-prolyl cis-trans isomerase
MNKSSRPMRIGWAVVMLALCGCQAAGPRKKQQEPPPEPKPPSPEAALEDGDPLHPRVKIVTSAGALVAELDAEEAPNTVLNFVQYLGDDFYAGTIFHRVLEGSMIQGGGYTPDMELKLLGLKPVIDGTWSSALPNARHTIAMIRGQGKGGSGSAQFYINLADNTYLDESPRRGRAAVFGKIVEGFETLDRIGRTPVAAHEKYADGRSAVVPVKPVVIESVRLLTAYEPVKIQAAAMALKARLENRVEARVAELEREHGSQAVATDSGLHYIELVVGTGHSPVVGDEIEFHYRGTLLDGTEFESTYGKDAAVRAMANLIPGLREALSTMKEGGRRVAVIPPELGFRGDGIPGYIPPDAVLVFEIDLLAIK